MKAMAPDTLLHHLGKVYAFAQLVTPEIRAGLASATGEFGEAGVYRDVIRQIGSDGWLGIGWPKEYGGQARSMVEQLIFTDAAAIAGVPIPYLTLNTVGPTIMRFGSDEQKEFFLPKILAGDLHFSIGYSEPGSGTDLASLKTKAIREVLPNVAPAMFSIALLGIAVALVVEGGLALIGVGIPADITSPSWGNLIATGRSQMLLGEAAQVMTASLMVFFTVLSLNYLGDVVRARFDVRDSAL